jgi:hypothetical protein
VSGLTQIKLAGSSPVTFNSLVVDFKCFKRFWKDTGVFTDPAVLTVNRMLTLDEEIRYHQVIFQPGGWQLIGDENAWNTTLFANAPTLSFVTAVSNLTIAANVTELPRGLDLFVKTPGAYIQADRSLLNILKYNDHVIALNSVAKTTFVHPFREPPEPYLLQNGANVSMLYQPLTDRVGLCVFAQNAGECTTSFTPIAAGADQLFPPAGRVELELHADATFILTNNSAADISVVGNSFNLRITPNYYVHLPFSFSLQNAPVQFTTAWPQIVVDKLASDVVSLGFLTGTIFISTSVALSGDGPLPSQQGQLTFSMRNANFAFNNAGTLPQIEMRAPDEVGFSNGRVKWIFAGFPQGAAVNYHEPVSVTLDSPTGSSSPMALSFPAPQSDLRVARGWQSSNPVVLSASKYLYLTLDAPASFKYAAGAPYVVTADTLRRMSFDFGGSFDLVVNSTLNVKEIDVGLSSVAVVDAAELPRDSNEGRLNFTHTEKGELVLGVLGHASEVTPHVAVTLMPGTVLRITEDWARVSAKNKVTIGGSGATIICEGYAVPPAVSIEGDQIAVEFVSVPGSGLSPAAIAGIVLGTIALVGLVAGVAIYLYRKRTKEPWDYDSVAGKVDPMPLLEL